MIENHSANVAALYSHRTIRAGRPAPSGRRQFRTNKGFHLTPNCRVAFDSRVVLCEYSEEPRILIALNVLRLVVETIIPENLRVLFVGSSNFGLAAQEAI